MGWWTVAAAALTGGGTAFHKKQGYDYARKLQKKDVEFQYDMSNTQHQRAVADLRAAGLNPILSATGGLSAGGGSASSSGPGGGGADLGSSAMQALRLEAEVDNINADTKLKREQATTAKALGYLHDVGGAKIIKEQKILEQQLEVFKAQAEKGKIDAEMYKSWFGKALRWLENTKKTVNPLSGLTGR